MAIPGCVILKNRNKISFIHQSRFHGEDNINLRTLKNTCHVMKHAHHISSQYLAAIGLDNLKPNTPLSLLDRKILKIPETNKVGHKFDQLIENTRTIMRKYDISIAY